MHTATWCPHVRITLNLPALKGGPMVTERRSGLSWSARGACAFSAFLIYRDLYVICVQYDFVVNLRGNVIQENGQQSWTPSSMFKRTHPDVIICLSAVPYYCPFRVDDRNLTHDHISGLTGIIHRF